MKECRDVLPEGFADPMLMSVQELESNAITFEDAGNIPAASFLAGVAFARTSMLAAGVQLT